MTCLAAGCLIIKRAEQLIQRKTGSMPFLISHVSQRDRLHASVFMALGSCFLLYWEDPDWYQLFSWLFFCILFFSGYTDYRARIIPNEGIVTAMFFWGLFGVSSGKPLSKIFLELLPAILFSSVILLIVSILEKWKKRQVLGRGDIKLLFVTALFLGMEKTLYVLLMACLCGLLVIALRGKNDKRGRIPFGPCIAFPAFLMLLI